MSANWTEVCISVARDETAAAEQALEAPGALLEPGPGQTPLWPTVRLRGLFEGDADRGRIIDGLRELRDAHRPGNLRFRNVGDRDWVRAWMDRFQPMRFGRRLWIVPGGMAAPDAADAVVIHLDPGLAFGTGTHPTTALCLEWLDGHEVRGRRVVDYGCGSGILGIAAALLGADAVVCVDNDPQALEATTVNAARNGVADRIACESPESFAEDRADIVLANILANPLIGLAGTLNSLVAAGGHIVMTGILSEQAEDVMAAYRAWFEFDAPQQRAEWVLLVGRKRKGS